MGKDNKATRGNFKKELGSRKIHNVKEKNINKKVEQAVITDAGNMENLKEPYRRDGSSNSRPPDKI